MPKQRRELKVIFFDIDDTLYSTTEFVAQARRSAVEAMRSHGLRLPASHILRELSEVIAEFSSNYDHHFDKLLVRLPERAYRGINPAVLVAAAVAAYHDSKFQHLRPFPEVPGVLRKLAQTEIIRGIITAGLLIKQAEKLVRLGVYRHFTPTAIFISDQIGISKPNPKLYKRACSELGILPAEAMYVGDHPSHDIDPCREIGMTAVLVRRQGRHGREKCRRKPDYQIRSLKQILTILRRDFTIPA
ncbi:MAG: TIGR02253 family HAD-type hydrolase [Planctomycetota bacterium]|jgi:putative hydrolase of the HAD superfamily